MEKKRKVVSNASLFNSIFKGCSRRLHVWIDEDVLKQINLLLLNCCNYEGKKILIFKGFETMSLVSFTLQKYKKK